MKKIPIFVLVLGLIAASASALAQSYSVLYDFGGKTTDPKLPANGLVQGADGALYGSSRAGGSHGQGAIFKIIAPGNIKVLYSFCAQSGCLDGAQPSSLTLRVDGNFIGTTAAGGKLNDGTIFEITPTGSLTKLYDFTGEKDGYAPLTPPILGPDGNFYGIAQQNAGCGSAYRLNSVFIPLYVFPVIGKDGCRPTSLVLGTDGNLYGTTEYGGNVAGGSAGYGTVFRLTRNGRFTLLHSFGVSNGYYPTNLSVASDGSFYGTTVSGAIFTIAPSGTYSVLHTVSGAQGSQLYAGLVQASDGNFYGAAETGGTGTNHFCYGAGCGTLFQITPAGEFTVLYDWDNSTGSNPVATPFQTTSGPIVGDTQHGGTYGNGCGAYYCGVLYSWNNSLPPFAGLVPYEGKVGIPVEILGQGFTASTTVSFNGTPASTVKITNGTRLLAYVPIGATSGPVTVITSSQTLTSNQPFIVAP
jgi:uncharacterized repeat protein (TIGR03803 family)